MPRTPGRDLDYAELRAAHMERAGAGRVAGVERAVYILYTSGTTGKPKGVQRDTGGYAVALAASMKHIYCGEPGRDHVHHLRHRLGGRPFLHRLRPLIHGMTTILYEGLPIRPDAGHLVEDRAGQQGERDVLLADRGARAEEAGSGIHDQARPRIAQRICSSRASRWTSRPTLDQRGARQAGDRPLLADRDRLADPVRGAGRGADAGQVRQPGVSAYGYDLKLLRETDASEAGADEKGVVAIVPPLPPGCMSTVWGDDERFVQTYFTTFSTTSRCTRPSTGASATTTATYFILGRTDDVINVAGHRLGTREIEERCRRIPTSPRWRWWASPTR
jgi:propionyl-CoA synthetase